MNPDISLPAAPGAQPVSIDWRGLGRAYLFFWYFSGPLHLMLMAAQATDSSPLRHGLLNSLLWLVPMLLLPRQGRRIAAVIGLILWAASLINLGYFAIYQQEFSQSVLFIIFESNPAESSEFIANYFVWWMIPALLVYSAGAWWLWHRVRPLVMPARKARLLSLLILFLVAWPGTYKLFYKADRKLTPATFTLGLANSLQPAVPWQLLVGYVDYRLQLAEMQALLEQNQRIPPIADLADKNAGQPQTLVLVIGESTNRGHMSLYGYARQTTPRLDALRDAGRIEVFRQVVASRPHTIETLQQALTFADQENPDLYLTRPSLMNIMKQAGYKTFWVTNQQTLSQRNTMLTNFSEQTDEQVYLNNTRVQNAYSFDGQVLKPFERMLADPAPRKFIVVHLLGTHMKYEFRYPDEFNVFRDKTGLPGWVETDRQQTMINQYDNAVLYNDWVVSGLIGRMQQKEKEGKSLLLYFSDHGEDVYDSPPHHFIGRNEGRPTPPMYTVPFLLWESPAWKAAHPLPFGKLLDRPWQTDHLIHTWADLAGLHFDGYDASKSLVSPRFKERPLLVGNPAVPKSLIDLRTLMK